MIRARFPGRVGAPGVSSSKDIVDSIPCAALERDRVLEPIATSPVALRVEGDQLTPRHRSVQTAVTTIPTFEGWLLG